MTGLDDTRHQLLAMLERASRQVDILSPQLEPSLLDDPDIVDALTQLTRRGRQSRIRIVIREYVPSQLGRHRLILLTQRLTSSMSLRVLPNHPEWNRETVIRIDHLATLLLLPEDKRINWYEQPADIQRWRERFDRLWNASTPSPELRRLL